MDAIKICIACNTDDLRFDTLSCSHNICVPCARQVCAVPHAGDSCPACGFVLTTSIDTLLDDFLKEPMNKLWLEHGFVANDILWTYAGYKTNQWLYTREQCLQIEEQYKKYMDCESSTESDLVSNSSDDSFGIDDDAVVGLNIMTLGGAGLSNYEINFESMTQYPKNDASKTRSINRITLLTYDDIKNNNVLGVGGKKF